MNDAKLSDFGARGVGVKPWGRRNPKDHRINWGRLFPGKTYKADCTCGWSSEGTNDVVKAAIAEHEKLI